MVTAAVRSSSLTRRVIVGFSAPAMMTRHPPPAPGYYPRHRVEERRWISGMMINCSGIADLKQLGAGRCVRCAVKFAVDASVYHCQPVRGNRSVRRTVRVRHRTGAKDGRAATAQCMLFDSRGRPAEKRLDATSRNTRIAIIKDQPRARVENGREQRESQAPEGIDEDVDRVVPPGPLPAEPEGGTRYPAQVAELDHAQHDVPEPRIGGHKISPVKAPSVAEPVQGSGLDAVDPHGRRDVIKQVRIELRVQFCLMDGQYIDREIRMCLAESLPGTAACATPARRLLGERRWRSTKSASTQCRPPVTLLPLMVRVLRRQPRGRRA